LSTRAFARAKAAYGRLFCAKVFCAAFVYLQFGFEIFWQKNTGKKAALKTLMKLTPVLTSIQQNQFWSGVG